MTPKQLRMVGERIGRKGLAERAKEIMTVALQNGSYVELIKAAGRLSILAEACDYDDYWHEKKEIGKSLEIGEMQKAWLKKDK